MSQKAVFLTARRPSATVPDERRTRLLPLCFEDTCEIVSMVVCNRCTAHPLRVDGAGGSERVVRRSRPRQWGRRVSLVRHHDCRQRIIGRLLNIGDESAQVGIGSEYRRVMHCLRCKGLMMVERHYTLVNRRLYARCVNCGFWIDLADLLRFFHKVIDSGFRGGKVRESFTL